MTTVCKGVKKNFRRNLKYTDYTACISRMTDKKIEQKNIISRNHVLSSVSSTRTAFSTFDDKRYCTLYCIHIYVLHHLAFPPSPFPDISCRAFNIHFHTVIKTLFHLKGILLHVKFVRHLLHRIALILHNK